MSKSKSNPNRSAHLEQQIEVLTLERNHLKQDIVELKRVIVAQAHEIERLRGMSKSIDRVDEYMKIYDKYNLDEDMDLPETT